MHGYPHFSFYIPIGLAKFCFFPIVTTFAKMPLYWEALSFTLLSPDMKMHILLTVLQYISYGTSKENLS